MEGLRYRGKFALRSRLGWPIVGRKFDSNLHDVFTETCREDVDFSKTQPCKLKTTATANYCIENAILSSKARQT